MQGQITQILEQERDRGRVNVYLDGEYAFSLRASVAARLRVGGFLSHKEAEKLLEEDAFLQAYRRAQDYLAYRPRSEWEIRERLRGKRVAEKVIEEVVANLGRAGLLDDLAFVRYWVENRERFRPRSRAMLRYELCRKGVAQEVISQVLIEVDEEASARRAAERQAPKYAHLDDGRFRERMTQFLRRRGFTYDVVRQVVDLWLQEKADSSSREEVP